MDIYEYLKLDHQKVDKLFKQFEDTEDYDLKFQIVALIIQELFVHAESEQATFYKALEQFEISKSEGLHGEKEHAEIEEKMDELGKSVNPTKAWEKKVLELKKLVQHHVKEEEGKMFSKAKKVLSKEQTYVIKEQMHYLKSKMLNKLAAS